MEDFTSVTNVITSCSGLHQDSTRMFVLQDFHLGWFHYVGTVFVIDIIRRTTTTTNFWHWSIGPKWL